MTKIDLTQEVLAIFGEISKVPRRSKREDRIASFLVDWAVARGFEADRDASNNVIMRVAASAGYEQSPVVVLQAHMDMVCEKSPESGHDFEADPIEVILEDGWIHANETTLGADNGLGLAIAMAVAADARISHPALEILVTSDEETGMTGAMALVADQLQGRILLNLDAGDEGVLTVGCAGGCDTRSKISLKKSAIPAGYKKIAVQVSGLLGGHSGVDIHEGRASALKLSARLIRAILEIAPDARLIDLAGGSAHNAIPRDAAFSVAVPAASQHDIEAALKKLGGLFASEYHHSDAGVLVSCEVSDVSGDAFDASDLARASDLMLVYPHGVAAYSQDVAGLVETSSNLAKVYVDGDGLNLLSSQRSSVPSKLACITRRVEACVRLAGGTSQSGTGYPPWPPDMASDLLKRCLKVYEARFGKAPKVEIIHAGLECGIIGSKFPGMEMVSFGPTILAAHSPKERAKVATISMVCDFLIDLLATYR